MNTPDTNIPKPGETWIEDDPRFPVAGRYVEILSVSDGAKAADGVGRVTIRRGNRTTTAQLKRFGKKGGYVRPGQERPTVPNPKP